MTEWNYDDNKPTTPGYYAIMYCYEPCEGVFTGSTSIPDDPARIWPWVVAYAGPFATEEGAEAWAEQHDPEYADEHLLGRVDQVMTRNLERS